MTSKPERIEPGPGQESVWDYPRPPRVETLVEVVRVAIDGLTLAESSRAVRVLETSHPPVIYVPPDDVRMGLLRRSGRQTYCEYKGQAAYYDLTVDTRVVDNVAWFYPAPAPKFLALKDFLAFYPSKVECYLAGERAVPQPGDFYGGWITSRVVGPFKGTPGTMGW